MYGYNDAYEYFDPETSFKSANQIVKIWKQEKKIGKAHKALTIIFIIATLIFYIGNFLTCMFSLFGVYLNEADYSYVLDYTISLYACIFLIFLIFTIGYAYMLSLIKGFCIISLSNWINNYKINCRTVALRARKEGFDKESAFVIDSLSVAVKPIWSIYQFIHGLVLSLLGIVTDISLIWLIVEFSIYYNDLKYSDENTMLVPSFPWLALIVFLSLSFLTLACFIASTIIKKVRRKRIINQFISDSNE